MTRNMDFFEFVVGTVCIVLLGIMVWLTAVVGWSLIHQPPCLQGHTETRHVEFECHSVQITEIEGTPVYGMQCVDAHNEDVFVCDQYELEKAK